MRKLLIKKIPTDFSIEEIDHDDWRIAEEIVIDKYWSGKIAGVEQQFMARLLWSKVALYVRFETENIDKPIINIHPDLSKKTDKLWDRDVCEIFIAPDPEEFRRYFEFEVAPTGEWLDLAIYQLPDRRETDFGFDSQMQAIGKIEDTKIWMAIKIGWQAFGKTPQVGDIWKGNLLRCVGEGKTRGYLAWQPTSTETPNFHVPEKFGDFIFG